MDYIFISYVKADAGVAEVIARGLEEAGYTVWYYGRDGAAPGFRYAGQIVGAIQNARAFIIVLSRSSITSQHIHAELICAYEHRKFIVPVRLGFSHEEFQQLQPAWRLPLSDTISIAVPANGPRSILPHIIRGLGSLEAKNVQGEATAPPSDAIPKGPRTAGVTQGNSDVAASLPGRGGDKFRSVARIRVPKISVFWVQCILTSFVFMWLMGELRGYNFNTFVPLAVFISSYLAYQVSDDLIVGGVTGSLIAGVVGGVAGYFAGMEDAYGALFGLAFGLINGSYLPGVFLKEHRRTGFLRACVITLFTILSLFIFIGVNAYRYGLDIVFWEGVGDEMSKGLFGATHIIALGATIFVAIKLVLAFQKILKNSD